MTTTAPPAIKVSEFLAWAESRPEPPHAELIDGRIAPVGPESPTHNRTKFKAARVLQHAMAAAGVAGETFTNGMLVPIDAVTAYEPDVLVRCGEPLPGAGLIVIEPVIVIEVISADTAARDAGAKRSGYFGLPSVQHYLVVDPDAGRVTHHARTTSGGIAATTHTDGTLRLDPPGLTIDIAALFA